jgi:hypothetical protein
MTTATNAEKAVIALLFDSQDYLPAVASIVTADDFHDTLHAQIFSAIGRNFHSGIPVSVPVIADQISPEAVVRLLEINGGGYALGNVEYFAHRVAEASRQRRIATLATELSAHPDRASTLAAEIIKLAEFSCDATTKPLFTSAAALVADASAPIQWAISKLIEQGTTGQLFGASGGGKTFVALCMALAVISGGITLNGRPAEAGAVLYLAGEGHNGLKRRIAAGAKHRSLSLSHLSNLHISNQTLTFDDISSVNSIIVEGRNIAESAGTDIRLVVIDTLARHICGDENSTRDMSVFIQAVDTIRAAFPGSVALIVHHTGNGEEARNRSRGSSALKAAMDFEMHCDKGLITFTKLKDGEAPEPIPFKLLPVHIGVDDDGEAITSCVIEYGTRSTKNRELDLTTQERLLLGLVHDYPEILSGDLRTVFFDKRREREPDAKHDTLKKAFSRALDGLIEKSVVHMDGNKVIAGQRDNTGTIRDIVPALVAGQRDTPFKGCPMSLPMSSDELIQNFPAF